jgi:murein DD-endopeptidase MepM/ murein hydrolase activator NlpD
MLSSKRKRARGLVPPVAGSLAVALAVAAAGCSSDVTRFKLGGSGTVGSIPLPNEPVSPTSYSKASPGGQGSVVITETDLSAAGPPDYYQPIGRGSNFGREQPPPTLGPPPKQLSDVPAGGTIEVQKGDTIYNIARRHGVAPAAIKDANNLASDNLRPGQRLVIPGANGGKVAAVPPQRIETREVKVTPIPVNPKPGNTARPDAKASQKDAIPRVRVENGAAEKGTAEAKQPERPTPAPQAEVGKFRWPVRGNGRLIVGYGKRPDGTHNDGINLAVPHGTDIFAVESGKVAYAGSELKGYGNLILIRHSNKWVSAYAHADQILVRSGDEVKKGQVIAKAGKTGSVDQPQLHFELRQDSRPVDPLPHLASAN